MSADITIPVLDGVGIVSLANADAKNLALYEITLVILKKLAGLTDESMSANLSAHPLARLQLATASARRSREEGLTATNELPPRRLDLTGTYDGVGYGTFTLCDGSSQSDECRPVLDDFSLVDKPSMGDPNRLFGAWPSILSSHTRFIPTRAPRRYLVDFGMLYPTGYGRNTTPFAHWVGPAAIADFVVDDGTVRGVGFSGIGEKEGYGLKEEDFDVWFSKRV